MDLVSWGWQPSAPIGCAGDGCCSSLDTWPLHHVRHGDVFHRLCSSCILLSYRNLYCCCCFLLLGPPPPTPYDDGDPLIAPYGPTTNCGDCAEAVAHLSCLRSPAYGVFVCPACLAARMGRTFTYAPPGLAPIDVRAARVILLATRMALAMLRRHAADARATAVRLAAESAAGMNQAYRELGVAFGVDTVVPSRNENGPPPLALEEGSMAMAPPQNLALEEDSMAMALPQNVAPEEGSVAMASPQNVAPEEGSMAMAPPQNVAPEQGSMAMAPPQDLAPEEGSMALAPEEGSMATVRTMVLDLNAPPPPSPSPSPSPSPQAEAANASRTQPPQLRLFSNDQADEDEEM